MTVSYVPEISIWSFFRDKGYIYSEVHGNTSFFFEKSAVSIAGY